MRIVLTHVFLLAMVGLASTIASAQASPATVADTSGAASQGLGTVVVSATRTETTLRLLPQHVTVLDRRAVEATPAVTSLELLRGIPGFMTRDFGSLNQLSQTRSIVSFRGLGGSSAGRTLMLLDDVPIGDPFTGFFDWSRIPLPLIESVEVVRGGSSAVWGSRSLGGVVNIRTRAPQRNEARMLLEQGAFGTKHGSAVASGKYGSVVGTVAVDAWNSAGYVPIRPDQAGPVDQPLGRNSRVVLGKLTWDVTPALRLWSSGSLFNGEEADGEEWEDVADVRLGLRWVSPRGSITTVSAFRQGRRTLNNSVTIDATRSTEMPFRKQPTDATGGGLSAQWATMVAARHELTVGLDASWAQGTIWEAHALVDGAFTREREMHGQQVIAGVFVQDAVSVFGDALRLLGSVRVDQVREGDRTRALRELPSRASLSDTSYGGAVWNRVTGSLGARGQVTPWLAWRATAYEGFRAPTLYEQLYPRFSNRGTITESNPALIAEVLRGVDVGVDLTIGTSTLVRVTGFTNRVESPILDITIGQAGQTATVISPCGLVPARQGCAQRQNVEGLLSRGVETELSWNPSPRLRLHAGNSYTPTRIHAPGQPADAQQTVRSPRHMVTGGMNLEVPQVMNLAVDVRHVGRRYDDDRNTIQLHDFTVAHLRLSRALRSGVTAYASVENLMDRQYEITRTGAGLAEVGAPRWATVGVRASW